MPGGLPSPTLFIGRSRLRTSLERRARAAATSREPLSFHTGQRTSCGDAGLGVFDSIMHEPDLAYGDSPRAGFLPEMAILAGMAVR